MPKAVLETVSKKDGFKLERTKKLQDYFKTFTNSDRLTRARLTEMMQRRYPAGKADKDGNYTPSICDAMVKNLWAFLESVNDLKFTEFCDKIENWVTLMDYDERVQK